MKEFQLKFITNKQTFRCLKILNTLERFSICSAKELAAATNNTVRTIVKEIADIKNYFQETIQLDSSPSGYRFAEIEPQQYVALKRNLLKNEPLFQIIESIFHSELQSLSIWSEYFHLSESTLIRYIKNVHPVFTSYQLTFDYTTMDLIGSEINIRRFFHDFYYESDITPHTILPSLAIHDITLDLQKEDFFKEYPKLAFGEFNYMLYIIIERFTQGKTVKIPTEISVLFDADDKLPFFKKIKQAVQAYFSITLTQEELIYLGTTLMCKRSVLDEATEKKFCERYAHWPEVQILVEAYLTDLDPPAEEQERTRVFLTSFFTSIFLKNKLSPILNQNLEDVTRFIKRYFPKECQHNLAFVKKNLVCLQLNAQQAEAISANLTLYIDSMKELYWSHPKNIAFFLEGNYFICQSIYVAAKNYIGHSNNLYFPDASEMSATYFTDHKIDIVVTNYSEHISDYVQSIPHLLFKATPDSSDWNRLLTMIDPRSTQIFSLSKSH